MAVQSGTGETPGSAAIQWECAPDGLVPELLARLARVAEAYQTRCTRGIRVVSGLRTLRQQAELMAAMSREQLEGMYCRSGYPGYIRELVELREREGAVSGDAAYAILSRRQDGFVSAHLSGAAIDIAAEGEAVDVLKVLLTAHGFRVLDERPLGLACIHATCGAVPLRLVRE